jgi:hypothetical protein
MSQVDILPRRINGIFIAQSDARLKNICLCWTSFARFTRMQISA